MSLTFERRAIRSLKVGVVPPTHVLALTVGAGPLRTFIDQEVRAQAAGKKRPLIVLGEWGSGKSNLLCYLREYCIKNNHPVSYINLNGRSSALNHPQRFYHRVASDMRLPDGHGRGIPALLQLLMNEKNRQSSAKWISKNLRNNSELARALYLLFNGDLSKLQVLMGNDIAWGSYPYQRAKAMRRLSDLGGLVKAIGMKGLMVQFDELETMNQLWNSVSRKGAYRVLNEICHLDDVWPIFAATETVNSMIASDANSMMTKDKTVTSFFQTYFDLPVVTPPVVDQVLAAELLDRIERLYRRVYAPPEDVHPRDVLSKWTKMALRNPRRLIRLGIDHLDRHRSLPDLQSLIGTS